LGNYLGAIKNWVELQNQHRSVFCVVDLHALTVPQDPKTFREKILSIAKIYLAAGIDPEKSIIFIQSHVKEHAELCWILNTISRIPELERMTQFKEKAERHKKDLNMGLFDYPVLMAADILLYKTNAVPVGEDQLPHLEETRHLARKFNSTFAPVFKIPEPLLSKTPRLMGLDADQKMSKSRGNAIFLSDSKDDVARKIKTAITDSGKEIVYDLENKPAVSNLLMMYHLFSGESIKDIEEKYQGKGYMEFKNDLAEVVNNFLNPIREARDEFAKDKDYLALVLKQGTEKAAEESEKVMKEARKAMRYDYSKIFH